jgi:putative PIN family toxin of toxin-antitoxin system
MIKVVIDTNVVVSATLVDHGPSAGILNLATNKRVQMCVSPAILAEYEKVLRRPRLKLDPARITGLMALIRSTSTEVFPSGILKISKPENLQRRGGQPLLRMRRGRGCRLFNHRQHTGLQQGPRDHQNHHTEELHRPGCAPTRPRRAITPIPKLRDEDEFKSEYDCPSLQLDHLNCRLNRPILVLLFG